MADENKQYRVVLKGPALVAALAIKEEMELSNLSDALSVFVDRCSRGQFPVAASASPSEITPSERNDSPGPLTF
ncbi:MAG: hypothetical protein AAGH78_00895 [Cyanobacteria bacterium P01_H01_bin.58]